MGLFDFIKKNPVADPSNLPTFENNGQSPESLSNFRFSRSNQGVEPDKTKVEQAIQPVSSSEQVRAATNQVMQEQPEPQKQTTADDVFTSLLNNRYKESEESLKRQRAADFWGNFAKLFGQTVTSAAGGRIFAPIRSNTQQYNQAIGRLRDSYNDTLANYTLSNARAERAAKAEQDKINLKFERDKALAEIQANLKGGLIDKQTAADIEKQARKAKDAKELEGIRNDFRMKLARYNQGTATGRAKMNNDASMQLEKYRQGEISKRNKNSSGSGKNKKKYPRMKFGNDSDVVYDLNNDTDVAKMYNEGVRIGYFPEKMVDPTTGKGLTIDDMREAILTSTNEKKKVHDRQQGWSLRDSNNNGWSLKDIE